MSQYDFFRLKDINGFTVNKVFEYKWKLWIEAEKRWVVDENYFEGGKKKYKLGVTVNGSQGYLEVSQNQLANMLEAYHNDGSSSIIGCDFTVKTNGKDGMDIRYYINPSYGQKKVVANVPTPSGYQPQETNVMQSVPQGSVGYQPEQVPLPPEPTEVKVEDIPF
jgi:hypothetical protein